MEDEDEDYCELPLPKWRYKEGRGGYIYNDGRTIYQEGLDQIEAARIALGIQSNRVMEPDEAKNMFELAKKANKVQGAIEFFNYLTTAPSTELAKWVVPEPEDYLKLNKELVWANALNGVPLLYEAGMDPVIVLDFVGGLITVALVTLFRMEYMAKIFWKYRTRSEITRSILLHPHCPCSRLNPKLLAWSAFIMARGFEKESSRSAWIELYRRGMEVEPSLLAKDDPLLVAQAAPNPENRCLLQLNEARQEYITRKASNEAAVFSLMQGLFPSAVASLVMDFWPPVFDLPAPTKSQYCAIS